MTVSARAGAAHNIGEFPFYWANTLGGQENLRGHRSTRFAGRTTFYQGYGGGLWVALFDRFVLQGGVGFSDDDRTVTVGLGFQY